jgi:hypothetical protein
MNYQQLYTDLLEAVKAYHANGASYDEKYAAYNTLAEHMSGRAKDAARTEVDGLTRISADMAEWQARQYEATAARVERRWAEVTR